MKYLIIFLKSLLLLIIMPCILLGLISLVKLYLDFIFPYTEDASFVEYVILVFGPLFFILSAIYTVKCMYNDYKNKLRSKGSEEEE